MSRLRPPVFSDPARPDRIPRQADLAPRVATTITAVVLCGFFAVAVSYVLRSSYSAVTLVECIAALIALCALQLCHSFPHLSVRLARYQKWTLALQAVFTFLPFAVFHAAWLGMPGILGASTLLVLPGSLAWAAFAGVAVTTGIIQFAVGYGYQELGYNFVATCLTGLVLYGLSRLTDLVREVEAARGELARLAVAQERLRFARDLHDLLGYSLSTITLKCELTLRLLPQPDRAEQELREILGTARQALADVRSVASGYRRMNLAPEIAAAEAMLAAVGIRTTSRLTETTLSSAADTVLATVLREGITNMLRHSNARVCRIEAAPGDGTMRLVVANDGVGTGTPRLATEDRGDGGSGLHNLVARVEALGGRLTAGGRADGWFQLSAEVPCHVPEEPACAVDGRPRRETVTASPTPALSEPRPRDCAR